MTSRTLSPAGIELIKTFEGLRLKAYLCPAGIPTIGYGHTGSVKLGDTITAAHAEHLLHEDLRRFETAIRRLVTVPLTQGQFDALVSFTFNVGVAAFQRSTLRRMLNTGEYDAVPSQLKRWVYGDPKKPPLLGPTPAATCGDCTVAELILPAPCVFVSSGGGIRIGASFGAEAQGEALGVFSPSNFDYFLGTSAGALDAALTANGWTAQQKIALFLDTDFSTLFAPAFVPFGLRKALALKWPISLKRLAHFMDGLGLTQIDRLLVNAVDAQTNAHVIYCEKRPPWLTEQSQTIVVEHAFSGEGLGTILTRSMALPGLNADHERFRDGGFAENPLLSVLPQTATGVLVNLGYPGLVVKNGKLWPDSVIEQAFYAVDRKGAAFSQAMVQQRPGLKVIDPKVYDVDSTAFGLSRTEKALMVERGFTGSRVQWLA